MAENTPESDLGSIECFQNYTAPEVFIQGLAGIVDQQDVEAMIRAQKQMLQRFEKTNEMLTNCNALSVSRLKTAGTEFKKHTQLLLEMKKDLDNIFKRIRVLKTKLSSQYPEAFEAMQQPAGSDGEEAEPAAAAAGSPAPPAVAVAVPLPDLVAEAAAGPVAREAVGYTGPAGYSRLTEEGATPEQQRRCRTNSSSSDSAGPNGNSNSPRDSSPCTSDTG